MGPAIGIELADIGPTGRAMLGDPEGYEYRYPREERIGRAGSEVPFDQTPPRLRGAETPGVLEVESGQDLQRHGWPQEEGRPQDEAPPLI
jgi:hypothetical protein